MSSFVHGDPDSEREMYGYGDDAAIKGCEKDARLVFLMTASVVLFTALVVGAEYPEHLKLAANVRGDQQFAASDDVPAKDQMQTDDTGEPPRGPDSLDDEDIPSDRGE